MPATREQLEARWETSEGQAIAERICVLLATGVPNSESRRSAQREESRANLPWPAFPDEAGGAARRAVTKEELQALLAPLPLQEEVAPALDLRGLHSKQEAVSLLQDLDLSGAHLEYMEIGSIGASRMVGTILDSCQAINASFIADFTTASFVQANLQGARFVESCLMGVNFQQAKLALARLRERDCRQSSFAEADLRFANLYRADLRGVDLSGANLTEANLAGANLSGIQFNERTRVQGANLSSAVLDEPFRVFAEQRGGLLREDQDPSFTELDRAKLAATIRLLKEENKGGYLDAAIACLEKQAQRFAGDPAYDWSMEVQEELSPEMMQEVMERYTQVNRGLAYFL